MTHEMHMFCRRLNKQFDLILLTVFMNPEISLKPLVDGNPGLSRSTRCKLIVSKQRKPGAFLQVGSKETNNSNQHRRQRQKTLDQLIHLVTKRILRVLPLEVKGNPWIWTKHDEIIFVSIAVVLDTWHEIVQRRTRSLKCSRHSKDYQLKIWLRFLRIFRYLSSKGSTVWGFVFCFKHFFMYTRLTVWFIYT